MRTYDTTFVNKKTKQNIIIIRTNANGRDKAKTLAIKNFKHTHRDINLNDVEINIKQIDTNNEDWL